MRASRKRKIGIIVFALCILTSATALVLYALRQNISLFYTPIQIAKGEAPLNHAIRIGGMVEKGSIKHEKEGLRVSFKVTDFEKSITVIYQGILPDLFREGQGIVAEGTLSDSLHFQASTVLAKHDANYMPPQLKSALGSLDKKVDL